MMPKIIHYCWFGGKPLPKSAVKCINSWRKYFPDYEIKEWNESNYDVRKIPYIAEAYDAKKYAFVSDYARFDILYQYGGIYFDTDVEVIKPFDDILERGPFMGCEIDGRDSGSNYISNARIAVNPGLGIGAVSGLGIYWQILNYYSTQHFQNEDGTINTETVVSKTTAILLDNGLKDIKGIQEVEGISVYPKEYFNPFDNNTGEKKVSDKTHSIHWYAKTWVSYKDRLRSKLTRPFHRVFGVDCFDVVKGKKL